MKQKRDYPRMLEEGFAETSEFGGGEPETRLEYLSEHIFNFTTYDREMSELLASKALEVCSAISGGTTFDYIKDAEQYRWYIVMCSMPFFADKLEWGTSIRGAWWGEPPHKKIEFSSCGLWLDNEQLHETMEFTHEQWAEFIAAILAFGANLSGEHLPTTEGETMCKLCDDGGEHGHEPNEGRSRSTGGLGAELERELRAAINPLYEDMRGTESYERKRLLGEIDALRADADEIEGLRWENAKLRPFVEQMARQNGDVYFQSLAKAALSPDVPPENTKKEINVTHT